MNVWAIHRNEQRLQCICLCHRLNDQDSAESVAEWIGTRDAFTVTEKVDTRQADGRHGTVRINKEYVVHPEQIKQGLCTGKHSRSGWKC